MTHVAVAFHAGLDQLQPLAESIAEGAGAQLVPIDARGQLSADGWDTLKVATTIIFGAPADTDGLSWQFRKFAAAMSNPALAQVWERKLFAGFTHGVDSLADKLRAHDDFFALAMQLGGLWVGSSLLPDAKPAAGRPKGTWIGSLGSAMAQSLAHSSAAARLPVNLDSGRQFGRQVAEAAARLEDWLLSCGLDQLKRGLHWR